MRVSARKVTMAAACAALAISLTGGTAAAAQTLTVHATGTMPTRCTLTSSGNFGTPNLASSGSVTAQALVNCNTGFKVNARSTNGAIINTTAAPSGFANAIPYSLTVSVPLDDIVTPLRGTCASSTLTAGQVGCSLSPGNTTGLWSQGQTSINQTATLTLAYVVPTAPTRLIAGSYSDTITLTIALAP